VRWRSRRNRANDHQLTTTAHKKGVTLTQQAALAAAVALYVTDRADVHALAQEFESSERPPTYNSTQKKA